MSRAKAAPVQKADTRKMEEETRLMEAKLDLLRKKTSDSTGAPGSGSRWRGGAANKPLTKGYAKSVLENPRRPPGGSSGVVSAPAAAGREADSEAREVQELLASLKLDRYVGLFMEHGFDCMEVVLDMEETHMREIGMAAGHILKLQTKLAELRPTLAAPPAEAESAARAPAPRQGGGDGESRRLAEGNFDEAESAAYFQEALQAWRGAGAGEAAGAARKSGSFWSTVGERDMDLSRVSTPARAVGESACETEASSDAPAGEKICCYQCYRQFFARYAVTVRCDDAGGDAESRRLCSQDCADRWLAAARQQAAAARRRREKLDMVEDIQQALARDEPSA